jgi:hypothetical protein
MKQISADTRGRRDGERGGRLGQTNHGVNSTSRHGGRAGETDRDGSKERESKQGGEGESVHV